MNKNVFRLLRRAFYHIPKHKLLVSVCMRYVDDALGVNNSDMHTNGELKILREFIDPAKSDLVIFDVGANRGDWTREVIRLNPRAEVHCFEPSKATYDGLVKSNFPGNVHCNPMGLGARRETLRLWIYGKRSGLNSLYRRDDQEAIETEDIEIDTLEAYCHEHGIRKIDLLKIDVEGHELAVLKGAEAMLAQKKIMIIQFEYGMNYIDSRTWLKDIFEYAAPFGCKFFKVMPHGLQPVAHYDYRLENFKNANYVLSFVHHEQP